jgi:hypothetical protein
MKKTIEVKQCHIDRALKYLQVNKDHNGASIYLRSESCPVALAVNSAFKKKNYAKVTSSILFGSRRWSTNTSVALFINKFDENTKYGLGELPGPFTFELEY